MALHSTSFIPLYSSAAVFQRGAQTETADLFLEVEMEGSVKFRADHSPADQFFRPFEIEEVVQTHKPAGMKFGRQARENVDPLFVFAVKQRSNGAGSLLQKQSGA